jgi:dienelactone hydrolase
MKTFFLVFVFTVAFFSGILSSNFSSSAWAAPKSKKILVKTVEYQDGTTTLEGLVAYPQGFENSRSKIPGILVVHDWTGVGPYMRMRVEKLAALGYIAFAADIYGKGVRPQPPEAGKVAGQFKADRPLMRHRAELGLEELKKQVNVDPNKIVAMGYCFGGTTILELARAGANLKGFISFHGGLDTPTPDDAKNIKGEVLVLTGADDPSVPPKQVEAFETEMKNGNVKYEVVKYPGAVHAFTVPTAGHDNSKGAAYNRPADLASWAAMKVFLKRIFQS